MAGRRAIPGRGRRGRGQEAPIPGNRRPRPPAAAWLIEPEGFSFPSKHTTLAALAAGASVRALGFGDVPAQTASLLAAAGIGASRVYLGVHWPTDVVAGSLFAEGWLRLTHPE